MERSAEHREDGNYLEVKRTLIRTMTVKIIDRLRDKRMTSQINSTSRTLVEEQVDEWSNKFLAPGISRRIHNEVRMRSADVRDYECRGAI